MSKQTLRRGMVPTFLENIEKGIDMAGHLRVLEQLTKETANPDNTHSIILQHVLPTTVEYIDRVNAVYPVDLVVAICYSADLKTVELLRQKNYSVYVPENIDEMLERSWKVVVDKILSVGHPVVIQEVGGYFANWTAELAKCPGFKGCVEDTKNGLWRYQAAAQKQPLAAAVLSMADTSLKRVEDSLIGDACVYSLEKVMRTQMASILEGVRCGVVGWGNIGKSVAAAFKGRRSEVAIYDINPIVNMLAYAQGYWPTPLSQLLSESDIVMGCSGRKSIRVADMDDLKDGAVLCSASSKDIEFDLVGFATLCDVEDVTPPGQACRVQRYTVRKTNKCFYVLKEGTPIDFLDTPLQGAVLDCTFSELFVCMRELATRPHPPGVVELTTDLQVAVAKKWLPAHSELFSTEVASRDKAFFYPESWFWD